MKVNVKSSQNLHYQRWLLAFATILVFWARSLNAKLHPIFDQRQSLYSKDLKSCLSSELAQHELETCRFFAIIMDAGSTGTRLHLFELSHDISGASRSMMFKVEREHFREVKPGLSSFAEAPDRAAASVAELLATARRTIPPHLWQHTPLALKATAGLRLLPEDQADAILEAVSEVVSASPFLTNDESVVVMSGTDEGVFGWFTLNILLERMGISQISSCTDRATPNNATAAAFDLGGGSTQITFIPAELVDEIPDDHRHSLNVFGASVNLFTHSYLGNGLVAARLNILQGHPDSAGESLTSSCFPEKFSLSEWDYAGQKWVVGGSTDYGFESCLSEVRSFVSSSGILASEELRRRDLYAFSYFFDRGLQAGLVNDTTGGQTTVGAFRTAASQACTRPVTALGPEHWRPWQCLDLAYIYSLLSEGYGLPDDKPIFLSKKLKGMETSWALGAAYHLLNTYHERVLTNSGRGQPVSTNQTQSSATYGSAVMWDVYAFLSARATTVLSYLNLLA